MSSLLGLTGSIPALGMFQRLAKTDESAAAAKYANTPAVKKELDYVKQQIGAMKTPEDLYKNYRVMRFVLSAYGLESELQFPGRIKKVLESDMSDANSLANKLRDARYRTIANALKIKATGLATLKDPATLATIVKQYSTNEYEKSFESSNPTIREGLYFLRNIGNVKSAYDILADPVLRKVVEATLQIPESIAVQPIETQAQLITKRLDIKQFQPAAATNAATAQITNATTDLTNLTKLLSAGDAASNAAKTIAGRLQAIKSAYDDLSKVQDPLGVNAAEIPTQTAAVPELLRQQGLLDAAQGAIGDMASDLNRMSQLRASAADPANAAQLASYKTEFAALAQHIHDAATTGAVYRSNGTDQSLLDGSVAAPITVQVDSSGHTVTVSPRDVSGFLALVDSAAAAFAAVTDASDSVHLGATASAISTGGPQLGAVRDAVTADQTALANGIKLVPTWAVTLDSSALGKGAASIEDSQGRAGQIATTVSQLRALAATSVGRAVGADRSDLTAQYTTLIGTLNGLVTTPVAGTDNLLAGGDRSYALTGSATLSAKGRDLTASVVSPLTAGDIGTAAGAQAVLDQIDGAVGSALDATQRELAIDADVFAQATDVYDPRGRIDNDFRLLAADLPGLAAAANVNGVNLLSATQSNLTAFSRVQNKSIAINAQNGFDAAVGNVVTAAAGQLPGNLSGAGGAYAQLQDALFAANSAASSFDAGRFAARLAISQAQQIIQQSQGAVAQKAGPTDFAKKFVNRYLGLTDAQALSGTAATLNDTGNQLLSMMGGTTSFLA